MTAPSQAGQSPVSRVEVGNSWLNCEHLSPQMDIGPWESLVFASASAGSNPRLWSDDVSALSEARFRERVQVDGLLGTYSYTDHNFRIADHTPGICRARTFNEPALA